MVSENVQGEGAQGHPMIVAQYGALRKELLKRIEFRYQLTAAAVLAFSAFLPIGLQREATVNLLLVYPLLGVFFAALWANNAVAIMRIAKYLKDQYEAQVPDFEMWETYQASNNPLLIGRKNSLLIGRIGIIATNGIFFGTQAIAMVLGSLRINPTPIEITLFVLDVVALVATTALLDHIAGIRRFV